MAMNLPHDPPYGAAVPEPQTAVMINLRSRKMMKDFRHFHPNRLLKLHQIKPRKTTIRQNSLDELPSHSRGPKVGTR